MEINKIDNFTFCGKPNSKKVLANVKRVFNENFPNLKSPWKYYYFDDDMPVTKNELLDIDEILKNIRKILTTPSSKKNPDRIFPKYIQAIKTYKVANCREHAEIANLILKINKIKKCDIFSVFVKKPNGRIFDIDHCVAALNVSKAKNNKISQKPFIPSKQVKIVDLWWPECFIGNKNEAKKIYEKFNINDDDEILLKPMKSFKINKKIIKIMEKLIPSLKIK